MVRNVTETRPVISRRRVLGIAVGSIGAASTVGSLASAAPPCDGGTFKGISQADPPRPEPLVTSLMTQELSDMPGKEVRMSLIEYPADGADPVHRHDAHGFIYVLEGTVVMQVRGGKGVVLTPGQTFYEGPTYTSGGRTAAGCYQQSSLRFSLRTLGFLRCFRRSEVFLRQDRWQSMCLLSRRLRAQTMASNTHSLSKRGRLFAWLGLSVEHLTISRALRAQALGAGTARWQGCM